MTVRNHGTRLLSLVPIAVLGILFTVCVWAQTGLADSWQDAEMSSIRVEGPGCDDIFAITRYDAEHFLVGPTGRTSVVHFKDRHSAEGEKGFFHGISFIGLYGYNGDVLVERDVAWRGQDYRVQMEGIIDRNVILLQLKVTKLPGEVCRAAADFAGFGR